MASVKYGVNEAGRVVCKTHEQAFPRHETCPWCVVKTWHSTLENVPPQTCEYGCTCADCLADYSAGFYP